MPIKFEWDSDKAESNAEKHGVEFSEAMTVFDDDLAIAVADQAHSIGEFRYFIIGESSSGRLLTVAYKETSEWIRIITAREATGRERKDYEQGKDEYR
jgi:uncharacterized DUF497 family protein